MSDLTFDSVAAKLGVSNEDTIRQARADFVVLRGQYVCQLRLTDEPDVKYLLKKWVDYNAKVKRAINYRNFNHCEEDELLEPYKLIDGGGACSIFFNP